MSSLVKIIITVVISYLIGSISPAILLGKAKGIDIKKEGSGNAGTTNVLRVMGGKAAAITLVIDILKGFLPVVIFGWIFGNPVYGYMANILFLFVSILNFAGSGHSGHVIYDIESFFIIKAFSFISIISVSIDILFF